MFIKLICVFFFLKAFHIKGETGLPGLPGNRVYTCYLFVLSDLFTNIFKNMFLFDFSHNKKYFIIANRAIQEALERQEERYAFGYQLGLTVRCC